MTNIDYGKIISRSWEITKKNKWLWIYGLILAAAGGGGNFSGGGGGGGNFQASPSGTLKDNLTAIPSGFVDNATQVLGATTNALMEWFFSVSPLTWILVVIAVVFSVLFLVIIGVILQNWAKGALIAGLQMAANNETVTLLNTSPRGISSLKNLIIYSSIEFLVFLVLAILSLLLIGLFFLLGTVSPVMAVVVTILGAIVGGLTLIVVLLLLAMVNIYAQRLIVIKGYSPWQAWKQALAMSKKSFLETIVMGIINLVIGCVAGCLTTIVSLIIVGVPALILLIPQFRDGFHLPGVPTIILLGLLILVFVHINLVVRAIIVIFNYANWNLYFEEVIKNE